MKRLLLTRLLSVAPMLLLVSLFAFLLIHLTATDPVAQIMGEGASAGDRADYAKRVGLDRPLPEQFVRWLWAALQGDFGTSLYTSLPVAESIADRIGVTLSLALSGIAFALLVGIPLGILGSLRAGSRADRALDRKSVV